MRQLKDSTGKAWQLHLTVGGVERVRTRLDLNLLQPVDPACTEANPLPTVFARLSDDFVLFARVLAAILSEQLAESGVSEEAWLDRFDGDVVGQAYEQFWAEYVDFFHRAKRPELAAMIDTEQKTYQLILARQKELVEQTSPSDLVDRFLSKTSGGTPDSSESTPAS